MTRWMYKLPLRFRSLFRKRHVEQELSDELRFHLEKLIEQNVGKGLNPKEARYSALRELGGVDQIKEQCRDARGVRFIETVAQDVRYGLRQLRRNPGFTTVAVLTLALGIAANTTIFSAVSEILLRKPPVAHPDRLCEISSKNFATGSDFLGASAPDFESWRRQNRVFEEMAAAETGRSFTLTGTAAPESVEGARVTPDYFRVIGVMPALGRAFLPDEGQPGKNRVVILSNDLWHERYGSDPNILGEKVQINGEPYAIVGIMPPGTDMVLFTPRLWTPLVFGSKDLSPSARASQDLDLVFGRLKPGITVKQAQAELSSIAQVLARVYPETNKESGVTVLTLQDYLIRSVHVRQAVAMLLVTVGFVLLIACANIAGLLLARGAARAHEMAVRTAVGASRLRLMRQMVVESVLIGGAGGLSGLVLSIWGIKLLRAGLGFNFVGREWAAGMHLDQPTLLFTAAISLITVLVFGLVPAVRASRVAPGNALIQGSRTGSGSFSRSRLRSVMVVGELVVALVLLAGAGILIQEVSRDLAPNQGFNSEHLLITQINLTSPRYTDPATQAIFFNRVSQKLRDIPGVESADATTGLPLGGAWSTTFSIVGQPPLAESKRPSVDYFAVGPDYFRTMEIPLMKGREFSDSDNTHAPFVAVINTEFARRFFPKGNAIGQHMEVDAGHRTVAQIVGVVGNVNDYPGQLTPSPQIYESYLQVPFESMSLVVRSGVGPSLASSLRGAVWSVDKDQPVGSIRTMTDAMRDNGDRLIVTLMSTFAGLALILAAVGIYGVIANFVNQRTKEFGIRIALGAQKKDVLGLVMREGGVLTGVGCAIGLCIALPLPSVFRAMFNGWFNPQGWHVAVAVALLVAFVSFLATYIPARRAANVDPLEALRYE